MAATLRLVRGASGAEHTENGAHCRLFLGLIAGMLLGIVCRELWAWWRRRNGGLELEQLVKPERVSIFDTRDQMEYGGPPA